MDRPPDFVADERGFDDVLHRVAGRRRRRHVIVGAATAVVVAAIAVPVVAATSSGTDTLVVPPAGPVPSGSTTPTPSVAPTTGGATAGPSAAPSAGGDTGGDVVGQPALETPPPAPASATAQPRSTPPTTVVSGPLVSTSMTRSRSPYNTGSVCTDSSGRSATGWCMDVIDANNLHGRSGEPVRLAIELCRLPGVAGQAHFAGTLEADLRLVQDDRDRTERWHYANQHPDRAFSHRYRVDGGTCLVWRTTWSVTADDGGSLEPGSYTLLASVNADNVATPNEAVVSSYRFTVDG